MCYFCGPLSLAFLYVPGVLLLSTTGASEEAPGSQQASFSMGTHLGPVCPSFHGLLCAEQEGSLCICLSVAMISLAPPLNTKDPSPRVSYL